MKPIQVTSPLMPPLDKLNEYLEIIWEKKWLTNNGHYHSLFENKLAEHLGVEHVALTANGTLALIVSFQALRVTGEVITTPYSFVASTHALWWNGIKPVFVDIDPATCCIDADRIESAITSKTTAILGVHTYGNPCDNERIERIAETYNLKVIYDAAHAFDVKQCDKSILSWGDISVLSFHATKTFSTIEGGAIICRDKKMKRHIDDLKNFGFRDELTVVAPGINAKMNEVQAAYGILSLDLVAGAIRRRNEIASIYRRFVSNISGISVLGQIEGVNHNDAYFPIFIDSEKYGTTRDALYEKFKVNNVFVRRYFYPLISNFNCYRTLESSKEENLSNANKLASQVLCLPIHQDLGDDEVDFVLSLL